MEFKSNIPIYLQVAVDIKKQIVSGSILPGEKLPSTRELAAAYTINPNTVARIYNELESQGVSFTRRGLGTYVSEDAAIIRRLKQEMSDTLTDELINELRAIGCTKEEIIEKINKKF